MNEIIPPRIFISYSHDSPEHMENVLALSERLRKNGVDCHIDQYEVSPPEGWPRWMVNKIEWADFVLVVCTETYHQRFKGKAPVGKGKGVKWEGAILTQELYDAEGQNTRFIPAVLSAKDTKHIPVILRGQTYYDLSSATGYDDLYRHITRQPKIVKLELGKIEPMPPKKRKTDFFSKDSLRRSYFNRVLKDSQSLYLSGIDRKAVGCEDESCLSLESVYTALLTRSVEKERLFRQERDLEEGRISALTLLDRHERLVLLGDPGSGKSTFVNFAAICLSGENLNQTGAYLERLTCPLPDEEGKDKEERQPWSHGLLLPVRIVLRDFAARGLPDSRKETTAEDLWQFIEAELSKGMLSEFSPFLRQELMEQGGIILLDGLDEVPEADSRREQIKSAVEDFAKTFDQCRILVTSRTYAYQKQNWRLSGFAEAELAPFSDGQIRRFVDQWYSYIASFHKYDKEDAQGRAELLKRAIFGSKSLLELAKRPILLTLMSSLHAWRGGSLPEKREELYADAVELLLEWWEKRKLKTVSEGEFALEEPSLTEWLKTDRSKVRALLNELAYKVHKSQPELVGTADIKGDDLVNGLMNLSPDPDLRPRRLVEYLSHRAGLLAARGDNVYTFPHRTFQEYLAACYLTEEDYPYMVADLGRQEPNRWREAVLLAGAKAARGSQFSIWALSEALCYLEPDDPEATDHDVWGAHLAAQALVETTDLSRINPRNKPKLAKIKRWLLSIIGVRTLPPVERALVGRNLARLGDPRDEVMTVDAMEFCLVPAGPFWMGEGGSLHLNESLDYDYWASRYPVTNAQYREFVEAGGYKDARYWKEAIKEGFWNDGKFKGWLDDDVRTEPYNFGVPFTLSNHPVVGVTWYEALAFTKWLTEKWQKEGILPKGWSIVLPSEAEWEKAARGGVEVVEQEIKVRLDKFRDKVKASLKPNPLPKREYPWGDEGSENLTNCKESGINSTSAVGCFPDGKSPYGCEEKAGNVWEWTRSLYDFKYPYKPDDGRENLEAGSSEWRTIRGGAYYSDLPGVGCGVRDGTIPTAGTTPRGFRCFSSPQL